MDYKIGDKILVTQGTQAGKRGVIICKSFVAYGCKIDGIINGHNLGYELPHSSTDGWWLYDREMELLSDTSTNTDPRFSLIGEGVNI